MLLPGVAASHLMPLHFLPFSHTCKTGEPSKTCANPAIQAVFGSVHRYSLADFMTLYLTSNASEFFSYHMSISAFGPNPFTTRFLWAQIAGLMPVLRIIL